VIEDIIDEMYDDEGIQTTYAHIRTDLRVKEGIR
jgi:hypothetical protein